MSAPSPLFLRLSETAAARPGDLAVRSGDRPLDYAEFTARTGSLAARVVDAVGLGDAASPIWTPVLVDRSVESMVAILGVIRAGRPFALVDAGAPLARIAEIFAQLGGPGHAVVASAVHAGALPAGVRAIPVPDASTESVEPQPVVPGEPAYAIFTSGSTGRPKGVVKSWDSLERTLADRATWWPGETTVAKHHAHVRPLYFVGAMNLAATVALGTSVDLFDPTAMELETLLELHRRCGIDSISPGPAVASAMARAAGGRRALPNVEFVALAGAATPWQTVAELRGLVSTTASFRCGYGSSESGGVMRTRVNTDDPVFAGPLPEGNVPLGRLPDPSRVRLVPLDPGSSITQLWIRDPDALSYLDNPGLTAERFHTDPDGTRWWVSGDSVVVDADGVYHHRGRVDDLAKINGMRVEPREPEAALRAVPGVADAVVLAQAGDSGRLRLVAHLRMTDTELTPRDLQDRLRETLPGYLVPSVFMLHDEFPLTVNVKVDRVSLRALPVVPWGTSGRREPEDFDQLGWAVLGIGRELLDLPDLGPDDDLWLAGMDSLAAVEFCAMVAAQGLGEIQPGDLVEGSTVAALARALGDAPVERTSDVVEYNASGSAPAIFAIPGAGATALTFRGVAQALGPEQPLVVVEAHGMHTRGRPDTSVEAMATRARAAIEQRLGASATQECVVVGHSAGAVVAYEVVRQRAARGQATRLVMIDSVPRPLVDDVEAPSASRPGRSRVERARERLQLRSWRALPAIAVRQVRIAAYRVRPGRPRPTVLRYSSFGWRLQRYSRQYRAGTASFPCTLLHVGGSTAPARVRLLCPDVEIHEIGGDHRSCVEYPHALAVAQRINDVAGRVSR